MPSGVVAPLRMASRSSQSFCGGSKKPYGVQMPPWWGANLGEEMRRRNGWTYRAVVWNGEWVGSRNRVCSCIDWVHTGAILCQIRLNDCARQLWVCRHGWRRGLFPNHFGQYCSCSLKVRCVVAEAFGTASGVNENCSTEYTVYWLQRHRTQWNAIRYTSSLTVEGILSLEPISWRHENAFNRQEYIFVV